MCASELGHPKIRAAEVGLPEMRAGDLLLVTRQRRRASIWGLSRASGPCALGAHVGQLLCGRVHDGADDVAVVGCGARLPGVAGDRARQAAGRCRAPAG